MEKKRRGTPRRPRQSLMLTPHTDSLSCGLLASGNVAAHHFKVKADTKGSGKNRKGGHRWVRLDMTGMPPEHEQGIRHIIITPDSNHWKIASLKSTQMNKIYIFTLVVWRYECIIQESTEKHGGRYTEKVHISRQAVSVATFLQRNVSQGSCECVVFTCHFLHSEESHDLAQMWFSLAPLC